MLSKKEALEQTVKCFTRYKDVFKKEEFPTYISILYVKEKYSNNNYVHYCALCQYTAGVWIKENESYIPVWQAFNELETCYDCPLFDFWSSFDPKPHKTGTYCPCEDCKGPYYQLINSDSLTYEEYQDLCQQIVDAAQKELDIMEKQND